MAVVLFPFLVCVIGLLLWAISTNGLVKECGRIMFQIGLFFTVWVLTPTFVHLFK